MSQSCKVCGKRSYSQYCVRHKPRTPIQTKTLPKKIGKQGRKTANAVAKWKRTQKPNHQGYFICYMCGKWITYLEAEHVRSKARAPELRTNPNNLRPTCTDCNNKKRSKDPEEI